MLSKLKFFFNIFQTSFKPPPQKNKKLKKTDENDPCCHIWAFLHFLVNFQDEIIYQIFLCRKHAWSRPSAEKLMVFQYFLNQFQGPKQWMEMTKYFQTFFWIFLKEFTGLEEEDKKCQFFLRRKQTLSIIFAKSLKKFMYSPYYSWQTGKK